jgi:hypothetical protein
MPSTSKRAETMDFSLWIVHNVSDEAMRWQLETSQLFLALVLALSSFMQAIGGDKDMPTLFNCVDQVADEGLRMMSDPTIQ